MPGEFDFIEWVRTQQPPSPLVPTPAGDDLAVLRWRPEDLLLVGADQVLDGVHFDSAIHSPRQIGRKVMDRNLSDCAAMACLPAAAVVTIALPTGAKLDYAKELYLGLRDAADPFDCQIVGGDTATWPGKLAANVTILGRNAGIVPVTRSGARSGDNIYVTGALGGSILGRHMAIVPRVLLARELAANFSITAMIDLSDGLSRDLAHIARQSRVAAIVDAAAVPIHADAFALTAQARPASPSAAKPQSAAPPQVANLPPSSTSTNSNAGNRDRTDAFAARTSLQHALHDGEDYELLFTAAHCDHPQVRRIGTIETGSGVYITQDDRRLELSPLGWEHVL